MPGGIWKRCTTGIKCGGTTWLDSCWRGTCGGGRVAGVSAENRGEIETVATKSGLWSEP
jgi:hypothetical protein